MAETTTGGIEFKTALTNVIASATKKTALDDVKNDYIVLSKDANTVEQVKVSDVLSSEETTKVIHLGKIEYTKDNFKTAVSKYDYVEAIESGKNVTFLIDLNITESAGAISIKDTFINVPISVQKTVFDSHFSAMDADGCITFSVSFTSAIDGETREQTVQLMYNKTNKTVK